MITFEIDKDLMEKLEKRLNEISTKGGKEAIKKALNDTAKQLKKDLAAEAKKSYTIKAGGASKAIAKKKATNKNLVAILTANGKPIPLIRFKTVAGNSVRAKVIKKNSLKELTLKGADNGKDLKSFVAKMSSGHVGVFQRVPGKTANGRQAIKEFYSTSIPSMLGSEKNVFGKVKDKTNEYLKEALNKQIAKILGETK